MSWIKWIVLSILILLTILLVLLHALEGFANGSQKRLTNHFKKAELNYIQEYSDFNGKKVRSILVGDHDHKTLICFVHGAPGCWNAFKEYMIDKDLLSKAKMISIDRLGYGESNYGTVEHSIDEHSLALGAVLENIEYEEIILVGHSFGGPIIANYAALFPEKIKLVYMVAPVINPDTEKDFWFNHILKQSFVSAFMPKYINVATQEKLEHAVALRGMKDNWAKIETPVIHLHGRTDWIAPPGGNLEYSKTKISYSVLTIEVWEDAGHLIPFDRFEKFKSSILNIISS